MIKNICDQYMKNHALGNRIKLTKDSYDEVVEEKPKEGFKEMFGRMGTHKGALASNPFANRGSNPFLNKQRPH